MLNRKKRQTPFSPFVCQVSEPRWVKGNSHCRDRLADVIGKKERRKWEDRNVNWKKVAVYAAMVIISVLIKFPWEL